MCFYIRPRISINRHFTVVLLNRTYNKFGKEKQFGADKVEKKKTKCQVETALKNPTWIYIYTSIHLRWL